MVTKFMPRPHFLSPPRFFFNLSLFPRPLSLSLLSTTATANSASSSSLDFPYGPSLRKGDKPPFPSLTSSGEMQEFAEEVVIDKDKFTRVFDISALRVPSEHCFALESRLRGHLLNWPRVRNIARVPGDEVDDDFRHVLQDQTNSTESLAALSRRIHGKAEGDGEPLSPVLYRDKLAKTFDSRGFEKFRNLAKLSRPKKRKKWEKEKDHDKKGLGKNDFAMVEVMEEEGKEDDFSGLLGEEFSKSKWRGSTRLLLLDERYAGKGLNQFPEAIQAVLKEDNNKSTESSIELVRCRLTLFYDYWQMNEVLADILPDSMIVPSAFETVGHIAHLNLKDEHLPYKKIIARVVLDKNKPKIQTVVNKIDAIHNDYRTMQLEVLAGNRSLVATVVENGLRFHVDLATVYWNSRLATERQRLLHYFNRDDVVCDVFAGVGPLAVSAAKKVKYVYANDLNPYAVQYLETNSLLNKVERKIEVFNMDGRRFIDVILASEETRPITQVVMNLPNDAAEYLDIFRGIFRRKPRNEEITYPKIHIYGFSKATDPEFDFEERIRIALSEVAFEVETRRVRLVAPGKWMLCASFVLPENVAFSKPMAYM